MNKKTIVLLFTLISTLNASAYGAFTIKDGWFVNVNELATLSVEEHYRLGGEAFNNENWEEAARQFRIIINSFPKSLYAQEAIFFLGASEYHLKEYDFANESFSQYLKGQSNPKYFSQSIEFKFAIAEQFRYGARRRFLGTKQLPKWASGENLALKIYDEVITAMPCGEIAAKALFSKGCLLWKIKDFRQSIESLQQVTKRFPKHELAPECYRLITKVYLEQCRYEFQNPDILALAQINLKRFRRDFPREERLAETEQDVLLIKEVYAQGLYDTGRFYERVGQPKASVIYYSNTIYQFPDTSIAELCRRRLQRLAPGKLDQLQKKEETIGTRDRPQQSSLQPS